MARRNDIIHISWTGSMVSASARVYGASTRRRSRRSDLSGPADASTGGMDPDVGAQDSRKSQHRRRERRRAKIKHCKTKARHARRRPAASRSNLLSALARHGPSAQGWLRDALCSEVLTAEG